MKTKHLLLAVCLFISLGAFAQNTEGEETVDIAVENNNYPIIGDNSAFGFGDGSIYINTTVFTASEGGNALFAHFLNAGISDAFSLSFGMANIDFYNPELLYLTPEVHLSLGEYTTLGFELLGIFPAEDLGEFLLNPSMMLSFGTPSKHFSIGYGAAINSEGDFEGMTPIDGFYAVAGIRANARIPVSDGLAIFSKNDYSSNNGLSFFVSRSGLEYQLETFNLYAGLNILNSDFGFGSDTEVQFLFGASMRL